MMPSMTTLRHAGTLAVALLLALTGCDDPPDGTGAGPEAGASGGANPSAAAPASAAEIAYPTGARAYAEAALASWRDDDAPRLTGLLTPDAHGQLIAIPGPPSQDWTYQRCTGAGSGTYCEFRNSGGETIGLRLENAQLGKARAVIEVRFMAA
jgi:hypothetical protein